MEETPILPLVVGSLLVFCIGYEVRRRRKKLKQVFDVFDKRESRVATALEAMVKSGALKPYVPGQPAMA